MPKTTPLPLYSGYPNRPGDTEARDAQREWQAHVDAGRIGSGAGMSAERLEQLARNERVLLGARYVHFR